MNKDELRKIYTAKRKSLSHKEIMIATDLLLIQFQNLHLPFIETVLSYRPIISKQEINMDLLESYLQITNPSIEFCYPILDWNSNTFSARATDSDTEFTTNAWGIEEPISDIVVDPEDIDLVFVPLLAFDQNGDRLGYGKGFYDRYLSLCRPDAIKIGFSFFSPEEKISDSSTLDIPLNFGITPDKIYAFS
ncbi:MAG: 5-formyltetrahydrofolate cyclo-ligase [Pseudopedobacter saltans]|uniref:5-formyltetrahydrofolate cyclo-ligase n=1 Tax=Pseudopedobacter saltans TaxID=151895 RepID=A0A2W5EWJ5_9SPHI|nr:MAG: 5-formyltetrahydrofolate cyclo-ligase [Pseudopedobacter saltans]